MNATLEILNELKEKIAEKAVNRLGAGRAEDLGIIQEIFIDSIDEVIRNHSKES